jgi:capsular polysaccharide export protein
MADLLDAADELHVMTSLAGFEALLRGKSVVCHGQPFYAGWGLTHDLHPLPRRTRRLTLEELVVAALIRYPCYFSRDGQRLLAPREAVDELIRWREESGASVAWWRHGLRAVLRRTVGVH